MIKKLALAGLMTLSLATGLLTLAPSASAQTPAADGGNQAQCYKIKPEGLKRVICGGNFIDQFFGDPPSVPCARGSCLQDNHCYLIGWGMIDAEGINREPCKSWRNSSSDIRELPNGASSSSLEGEDIFGVTRKDLQNCKGDACLNNNPITKIAIFAINLLSALIGVIVVGVIIMAGIQYSSSGGNPQTTAAAKKRIINAIFALIVYFFLFAGLQWLIPGGLFK